MRSFIVDSREPTNVSRDGSAPDSDEDEDHPRRGGEDAENADPGGSRAGERDPGDGTPSDAEPSDVEEEDVPPGYDDGPAPRIAETAGTAEHLEPDEPDFGTEAETVEFDVTTGEDLVERLPDDADVPPEVRRHFWAAAVMLNVAIFTVSLAAMLAYFWGWYEEALALLAVGVVAGIGVYRQVRKLQRVHPDADAD